MRIRKRYALVALASVAAFAVGGIASANHTSNTSTLSGSKICTTGTTCPSVALPKNLYKPVNLFVHTGTVYSHPNVPSLGGKAKTVTLLFDDDGKLNLAGIPKCTAAFTSSTTIAQAWEACGPGADVPASDPKPNAYLSPPNAVSGKTSTAPASNFGGCSMTFNGPTNAQGKPTVLLFARVTTTPNSNPSCASPATNAQGNTTVILKGTITDEPAASDFGKRLTVPGIDALPLPLDDYTALTRRASVFTARCFDADRRLNMRGIFQYSGTGQPADTVNISQPCTVTP